MKPFNKCIAGCLIISVTALLFPNAALCHGPRLLAKSGTKKITQHEPVIKSTSAKAIPMEPGQTSGVGKWVLIGLGSAAVIALLAGGGGGGDGGGGDDNGPEEPAKTGNVSFGW